MAVNNLWYVCIVVRLVLAMSINNFNFLPLALVPPIESDLQNVVIIVVTVIGIGFLYKAVTGSNEEYQIDKVFWHSTRSYHAVLFLAASLALTQEYADMAALFLIIDVIFSIGYRFWTNQ